MRTLKRNDWLAAALFAALIAVGAQISFRLPGTDLPQTAQTLGVLLAGAFLGFNAASVCIALYLIAGALGLPVFANGGSGFATMFGPSGGYLLGFWCAACLLGYLADKRRLRRPFGWMLLMMFAAHMVILLVGASMLSFSVGVTAAWFNGVQPFLIGAVVKSLMAGAIVWLAGIMIRRG